MFTYTVEVCTYIHIYIYMYVHIYIYIYYTYMSICCDTFGDRKPCVSITVYVCMYVCMHTSVCMCVLDTAQATRASESCNNSVECSRFA